jgi:hypothetical protein
MVGKEYVLLLCYHEKCPCYSGCKKNIPLYRTYVQYIAVVRKALSVLPEVSVHNTINNVCVIPMFLIETMISFCS